jgi:hypothetical protein
MAANYRSMLDGFVPMVTAMLDNFAALAAVATLDLSEPTSKELR